VPCFVVLGALAKLVCAGDSQQGVVPHHIIGLDQVDDSLVSPLFGRT